MSNYRDDTQETAVASDFTWAGLGSIAEESARIVGTLAFGSSGSGLLAGAAGCACAVKAAVDNAANHRAAAHAGL